MSRTGKQIITLPSGTTITHGENGEWTVAGPKGSLTRVFRDDIEINVADDSVTLKPVRESRELNALWGTYASHIKNMVTGVNEPFVKKLEIEGVGYRAELKGKTLVLQVGFSHPVEFEIPEDLDVEVEKNLVTIAGVDKERVGHFAAVVRATRKPEPYKGKGIHYLGEIIRRKEGKKAV